MASLLMVGILICIFGGAAAEWTHGCPTGCICMWISGRKTAECRDGGFTSLPVGLSGELQALDLRGNAIATLRNYAFRDAGLVNLNKIKMNSCRIRRVEARAFAELKILIELDLSDNEISELSMDSFETNDRLREFQISGNPLVALQGPSFPPLLHFQKLSLRNCQLRTLPPRAFEQLSNLEQLDLSGNQFETLDEGMFQHLAKLKAVSLHENPWKCDCRLKGLRDWALSHKLLGVQPTKCAQPDRLANFEWSQLVTTHFACAPEIVTMTVNGQAAASGTQVIGELGQAVRLECLVKGNPTAEVRWVKDAIGMTNSTASANGKLYFVQISGEGERWVNLTLSKTNSRDAGEYTCVGENKAGSSERNLSLTFEAIPPGAGAGFGIGGGVVLPHSQSWIWILIICLGAMLTLSILLVLLLCLCFRKTRKQPKSARPDFKAEGYKLNGGAYHSESTNQEPPMTRLMSQHEMEEPLMTGREMTLERSKVTQENGFKETAAPLLTPEQSYKTLEPDPDYPDLLDLPRRHVTGSPAGSAGSHSPVPNKPMYVPQTLSNYYRRPLELNPSSLYDPTRNEVNFYGHPTLPHRRPHSPFSGSVASFASEPPQRAIVPPPHRPGYVTLPRRPRLNSWAPKGQRSVSPGGFPYVKYDNLGARRTADGSSRQSLNKLENDGLPPVNYPSSTLPAYPRGRGGPAPPPNPHPLLLSPHSPFDPIEETNEGTPFEGKGPPHGPQASPSAATKKLPPKPPPKPKKKTNGFDTHQTMQRDDGTEI